MSAQRLDPSQLARAIDRSRGDIGAFGAPVSVLGVMCQLLFGCPQMAEDDFRSVRSDVSANGGSAEFESGNGGTGTGARAGSTGGSSPGRGGQGGSGGARASNNAGNSGSAGAPGGVGGSSGAVGSSGGQSGAVTDTCSDGWMNGDETGIDCGGSCATCACNGEFAAPELVVSGLAAPANTYGPDLALDNRTLYFSDTVGGEENLYRSERADRGSTFADAAALATINTTYLDGSPYVTPDGLTLYFFSDRPGGPGDRDLWTATRSSATEDFGSVEVLANVNSTARDHFPWLTPDRRGLLFSSDRSGGKGGWDIWIAERSSPSGDFSAPRNLAELNSGGSEQGMTLSRDGLTIIFPSNRVGGLGATDLWSATRLTSSAAFSTPVNLGQLNSADEEDDPKLTNDGQELFFSSSRDGVRRIWHALRTCD